MVELYYNADGTVKTTQSEAVMSPDAKLISIKIPPIMFNRIEEHVKRGSLGATNRSEFITRCIGKALYQIEGN